MPSKVRPVSCPSTTMVCSGTACDAPVAAPSGMVIAASETASTAAPRRTVVGLAIIGVVRLPCGRWGSSGQLGVAEAVVVHPSRRGVETEHAPGGDAGELLVVAAALLVVLLHPVGVAGHVVRA